MAPTKERPTMIDFGAVPLATLRRYKKQYGVRTARGSSATKSELIDAVGRHFAELPAPAEEETIAYFIAAVRQQNRETGQLSIPTSNSGHANTASKRQKGPPNQQQ